MERHERIEYDDFNLICKIADRGLGMAREQGVTVEKMTAVMDIESAHQDCPMNLERFLEADNFNFAHDFFGIRRHLDRTEYPGTLTDCFVPRFAIVDTDIL